MNGEYVKELERFCNEVDIGFLQGQSILIAGASGLIGSYLVDVLMHSNRMGNKPVSVYAIVRDMNRAEERFHEYLGHASFNLVKQDIGQETAFDFSADYIVHSAGNANPAAIEADPVGTIKANVNGTFALLDYAKSCKAKKFLYLSSSEIYGEPQNKETVFHEENMGVIDPVISRSCYPESKRMAENICVNYWKQYGVHSSIARVSFAYGPTYTERDNRVIPQFMGRALKGEDLVLKSTGSMVRSYTYLFDVVSGLMKILKIGKAGEAYNIANSGSNVSIGEIAKAIAVRGGVDLVYELPEDEQHKGCAPFSMSVLDAGKLESLGWKPVFNLEAGIERMFQILGC